jgi:hypothetical protein
MKESPDNYSHFSFMTYHRVCNWSNTTSTTDEAGTDYSSGACEVSSSKRFNSTSLNMTLTFRTEGDYQSVQKALCDKIDENGGEQIHYSYEKVPTSNKTV